MSCQYFPYLLHLRINLHNQCEKVSILKGKKGNPMNDKERCNAIISAISHKESCLAELDKERHKILAELESLNAELLKLTNHTPDITSNITDSPHKNISKISSPEEKIALFGRLFRGRVDVYPRLWISRKTGKKGFRWRNASPSCHWQICRRRI